MVGSSMDKVFEGENSLWIETSGVPVVQGLYFHQKVKNSTLLQERHNIYLNKLKDAGNATQISTHKSLA
ncbi:hypothetical protein ACB092_08G206000 [Castanea dentata]